MSADESIQRLFQKFGLDQLEGNQLRFLILQILSESEDHASQMMNNLRKWIPKINPKSVVEQTASLNEIKNLLNEKLKDSALEEKKSALSSLQDQKKQAEKEVENLGTDLYYGPRNEFYKMKGQCYKKSINKYTYEACPFGSAKQDSTSLGHNFKIVNEADQEIKNLGWDVHVNEQNQMSNGDVYFSWEGGSRCWNGPQRSLKLKLVCHDSVELLQLIEPSMCVYVGELGTPAVCPLEN